jgi:hypothetical protein
MAGEAQYIADTFLIEKLAKIEFAMSDDPLVKEAQLGSVLGGVANSLVNTVRGMIDTSSTGGLIKSVINLLSPAIFFRLNPLLGILYTIGSTMFGIDLGSILSKIAGVVIPKLKSGAKVTADEINEAGKSVLGAAASDDLLHELRMIEKRGELHKLAIPGLLGGRRRGGGLLGLLGGGYGRRQPTGGAFAFPGAGVGALGRMFGFLDRPRGSSLLVGFIVWFVKTILLSAGLLAGAGAISGVLGIGSGEATKPGEVERSKELDDIGAPGAPATSGAPTAQLGVGPGIPGAPQLPGAPGGLQFEELEGRTVEEMVMDWAIDANPRLRGHEDTLANSPSFNHTVRILGRYLRPGSDAIIMPEGWTRPMVVNQFIGEVNSMLQRSA